MIYCPNCTSKLETRLDGQFERRGCSFCGFIHWGNPVPVAAAIVEHDGKILLARNSRWTEERYRLITGYIEQGETPEQGAVREVREEIGLTCSETSFVGHYHYELKNELIIAFHVRAHGEVRMNHEIADVRWYGRDEVVLWDSCTGHALRDWLEKTSVRTAG